MIYCEAIFQLPAHSTKESFYEMERVNFPETTVGESDCLAYLQGLNQLTNVYPISQNICTSSSDTSKHNLHVVNLCPSVLVCFFPDLPDSQVT